MYRFCYTKKSYPLRSATTYLISCKTGLNVGGKTRNLAFELVLQQCCKTSCMFLSYLSFRLVFLPSLRFTDKPNLKKKLKLAGEKIDKVITTVFVDTRLSKTKHPRKRFQNFRQSCMLSTDRIEIHQSQPASMT